MKKIISLTLLLILIISCNQNNSKTVSESSSQDSILSINGITEIVAENEEVFDLTKNTSSYSTSKSSTPGLPGLKLVKLSGRVHHFGYDLSLNPPQPIPFPENVSDVKVWISEYPLTKL